MEAGEHTVRGVGPESRGLPGHDSWSRIWGPGKLVPGDGRQFPCSESELLDPREVAEQPLGLRFHVQERLFSLNSPPISAQVTVLTHHPVTVNHERSGVRGARPRHCSRRLRLSDRLRDFGEGACLAERNLSELLPHPALERCRPYVERQVEIRFTTIEIRENCRDPPLELATLILDNPRRGKLGDQLGCE